MTDWSAGGSLANGAKAALIFNGFDCRVSFRVEATLIASEDACAPVIIFSPEVRK